MRNAHYMPAKRNCQGGAASGRGQCVTNAGKTTNILWAPRPEQLKKRAGQCPRRIKTTDVIARSAATWQSVFPWNSVRYLGMVRRTDCHTRKANWFAMTASVDYASQKGRVNDPPGGSAAGQCERQCRQTMRYEPGRWSIHHWVCSVSIHSKREGQ